MTFWVKVCTVMQLVSLAMLWLVLFLATYEVLWVKISCAAVWLLMFLVWSQMKKIWELIYMMRRMIT